MKDTAGTLIILNDIILPGIGTTLYMVFFATLFSVILGLGIAMLMILTESEELSPNRPINLMLETTVNIVMSFPFIILAVVLIPITTFIMGTSIGPKAALVPLIVAQTPFNAKLFRDGLREVDKWIIKSAKSFGATNFQILCIMLKEAIPYLTSGSSLAIINTLSTTSMSGTIGAGGLGAIALVHGYQRANYTAMSIVIVILLIFVQVSQWLGDFFYNKLK